MSERKEGPHSGACTDRTASSARARALAWASLLQPLLLLGGTSQDKDFSKVATTQPGKARWQLLGLAGLSALRSRLF